MGVGIYFEWNAQAHKAMADRLLGELLSTAALDVPVELGGDVLDLLLQPLHVNVGGPGPSQ